MNLWWHRVEEVQAGLLFDFVNACQELGRRLGPSYGLRHDERQDDGLPVFLPNNDLVAGLRYVLTAPEPSWAAEYRPIYYPYLPISRGIVPDLALFQPLPDLSVKRWPLRDGG